MSSVLTTAGERALAGDVEKVRFQLGVDRGYWRLVSGPEGDAAIFEITAAPRTGAPAAYTLRLVIDGYPERAPAGCLWDAAAGAVLAVDRWPTGGRAAQAFNAHWQSNAVYLPVDRMAIESHDAWRVQHPRHAWNPAEDVTQYLSLVHEILNEDGYEGVRGA